LECLPVEIDRFKDILLAFRPSGHAFFDQYISNKVTFAKHYYVREEEPIYLSTLSANAL
jgi:hypothetical protein